MKLYNKQMHEGRYFLHEHPWTAKSWKEESVQDTVDRQGVVKIRSDMCKFGMFQETEKVCVLVVLLVVVWVGEL